MSYNGKNLHNPGVRIEWTKGWCAVAEHAAWRENISFADRNGDNYNVAEKIALVHSELSEALEAFRKNLMDDHLPNRTGIEVELADVVIRVMGIGERLRLDIAGAVLAKAAYNDHRADHRPENRLHHIEGKKF